MRKTFFIAIMLTAVNIYGSNPISLLEYVREASYAQEKIPVEDFYSVAFDEDMYNYLNKDYTNLRIYDNQMKQIPFAVQKKYEKALSKTETTYRAKIESIILNDKEKYNRIELYITGPSTETTKSFITEKMIINTSDINFEKIIRVYSSSDGKKWNQLITSAKIYDYSRIANLRNTEITIPETSDRFFKLEILNFSEVEQKPCFLQLIKNDSNDLKTEETGYFYQKKEFKIDSVVLLAKSAEQQVSVPAESTVSSEIIKEEEVDRKQIFEIKTSCSPVISFDIMTDSQNFIRNYKLEYSENGKEWYLLSSGKISSFALPDLNRSNLSFSVSRIRAPYYRMTIYNNDNQPLKNVHFLLKAEVFHALFLYESANLPVKVYYGGSKVPIPRYDVSDIISYNKDISCCELKMSEPMRNPDFKDKPTDSDKEWFTIAMYSAFIVAAIVLILILVVCLRKFESSQSS